MVGLLVDDPEELADHGGVHVGGRTKHGGGGTLDGGQGRPQLVAHHAQELGPQPVQLLQRRHVLEGDDHRLDLSLLRADGGGVEQHGDAPAVGDADDDLLGPHRLARAERLCQGKLPQRDFPPVSAPEGQHVEELLRRLAGVCEAVDEPSPLPVEGHRDAGPGVEHHDAHRRGVDQRLKVGPGPLLLPVPPRIGDGHSRMGREHRQGLLVILRELPSALLVR